MATYERIVFDINRLARDELIYELKTRGIHSLSERMTVMQMRTMLRDLIRQEKLGLTLMDYPQIDFAPMEIDVIETKLSEVVSLIEEFPTCSTEGNFRKIRTKLSHISNRVNRIPATELHLCELRERFLRKIVSLGCELLDQCGPLISNPDREELSPVEELADDIDNIRLSITDRPNQHDIETRVDSIIRKGSQESNKTIETCQHWNASEMISSTVNPVNPQRPIKSTTLPVHDRTVHFGDTGATANTRLLAPPMKTIPVSKWNLKFSGEKNSLSVSAFLERVHELCQSRNFPEQYLIDQAVDLFSGQALIWFRSIRDDVTNWSELKTKLKQEFQPYDYDFRLLEECRRRTQGPDESIGIYVAVMKNLFRRMAEPPSDQIKLQMILRNLAPFYLQGLGFTEFNSIDHLVELGRRLEDRRSATDHYKPPTRKKGDLEPDLAYLTDSQNSSEVPYRKVCFHCKQPGHFRRECPRRSTVPSNTTTPNKNKDRNTQPERRMTNSENE